MYAEETILSFYLLLTHVYKTYDDNEFGEIFSTRNSSAKNNRFDEYKTTSYKLSSFDKNIN